MTENIPPTWSGDNLQQPGGHDVTITVLTELPEEDWLSRIQADAAVKLSERIPGNTEADWEPKDFTGSREPHIVPMNSCGYATYDSADYHYLATGNLNGCMAIAAGRHGIGDTVEVFEEHYAPDAIVVSQSGRAVDKNGRLKMGNLLAGFASSHAVEVVFAYPTLLTATGAPPTAGEARDNPETFPVEALVEGFEELPAGSNVLLLPYNSAYNTSGPNVRNVLYVGRSASGRMYFGWNAHRIENGEPRVFNDQQWGIARALGIEIEEGYRSQDRFGRPSSDALDDY